MAITRIYEVLRRRQSFMTSLFTPRYKLSLNNHSRDDLSQRHCLYSGTNSVSIIIAATIIHKLIVYIVVQTQSQLSKP